MAAAVASFDSGHADMVHDCALDFSGRRAASCGSDRLVKVFDLGGVGGGGAASAPVLLAEIAAHEGPVWAVAWAHPRFGTLLASASYDGTVAVHREAPAAAPATNVRGAPAATAASSSVVLATGAGSTSASRPGGGAWPRVLSFEGHAASVNGLAWAPQELGLCLATASADGKVAVITHHDDETWTYEMLQDCPAGVNAVSWAPAHHLGAGGEVTARLASAGCDGKVRVHALRGGVWTAEAVLAGSAGARHDDWVRDVAWSPASGTGSGGNLLASCGDEGRVLFWRQAAAGGEWTPASSLPSFATPVWRLSWNAAGSLLAVSCGDNSVTVWREAEPASPSAVVAAAWQQVAVLPDASAPGPATPFFGAQPALLPAQPEPQHQPPQPAPMPPQAQPAYASAPGGYGQAPAAYGQAGYGGQSPGPAYGQPHTAYGQAQPQHHVQLPPQQQHHPLQQQPPPLQQQQAWQQAPAPHQQQPSYGAPPSAFGGYAPAPAAAPPQQQHWQQGPHQAPQPQQWSQQAAPPARGGPPPVAYAPSSAYGQPPQAPSQYGRY